MTTERSPDFQVYDDFDKPDYSLNDYAGKWTTPYGLGEMAVNDTRNFSGGRLNLRAVPFQTASDASVNDHLKYQAVSARTFPVPENGTLVLSSDIKASTPGTVPGLIQHGVYGPPGSWLDPASPPAPPGFSARLRTSGSRLTSKEPRSPAFTPRPSHRAQPADRSRAGGRFRQLASLNTTQNDGPADPTAPGWAACRAVSAAT